MGSNVKKLMVLQIKHEFNKTAITNLTDWLEERKQAYSKINESLARVQEEYELHQIVKIDKRLGGPSFIWTAELLVSKKEDL